MQNRITILALTLTVLGVFTQYLFGINNSLTHLLFMFIAIVIYWLIKNADKDLILKSAPLISIIGIFFLLLLLLVADPTRGSQRWFTFFGFGIQPSMLFTPFFILTLSIVLSQKPINNLGYLSQVLLIISVPLFLVFKQPDLGTALVISISLFAIIIFSNIEFKFLLFLLITVILAGFLSSKILKPYQIQRLTSFLNPNFDPSGINYNSLQSLIALGSGGWFGKGFLSASQSKLHFLPEARTDFVFASLVETFGFIGGLIVLLVFFLFFRTLIKNIFQANKLVQLFSAGAFVFLFVQFTFNIGMNLRILPVVGVPLPFISYSGSSLLTSFILLGILDNLKQS